MMIICDSSRMILNTCIPVVGHHGHIYKTPTKDLLNVAYNVFDG